MGKDVRGIERGKCACGECENFMWSDGATCGYRVFLHDVTAAILVSQNNETAAMLVSQTNLLGVELFSYAYAFFCSNKLA